MEPRTGKQMVVLFFVSILSLLQVANSISNEDNIRNNFGFSRLGYTKKVHSYLKTSETFNIEQELECVRAVEVALRGYSSKCELTKENSGNFTYFNKTLNNVSQATFQCIDRNMIIPKLVNDELKAELLQLMRRHKIEKVVLKARLDLMSNKLVWEDTKVEIETLWTSALDRLMNLQFPTKLGNREGRSYYIWLIAETGKIVILRDTIENGINTPLVCMRREWQESSRARQSRYETCRSKYEVLYAKKEMIKGKLEIFRRALNRKIRSANISEGRVGHNKSLKGSESSNLTDIFSMGKRDISGMLAVSIPRFKHMFPHLVSKWNGEYNASQIGIKALSWTLQVNKTNTNFQLEQEPFFEGMILEYLNQVEKYATRQLNSVQEIIASYERMFYNILANAYISDPSLYQKLTEKALYQNEKEGVGVREAFSVHPKARRAVILPGRTSQEFVIFAQFAVTSTDLAVYEIIPIPIPTVEKELVIPIIHIQHIIVTNKENSFYELPKDQLEECLNHICEIGTSKVWLKEDLCGPAQLTLQIAPDCKYKPYRGDTFFRATPRMLYYSVLEPIRYALECFHSFKEEVNINRTLVGMGTLRAAANCRIRLANQGKQFVFPRSEYQGDPPVKQISIIPILVSKDRVVSLPVDQLNDSFRKYLDKMANLCLYLNSLSMGSLIVAIFYLYLYISHKGRRRVKMLAAEPGNLATKADHLLTVDPPRPVLKPLIINRQLGYESPNLVPRGGHIHIKNPFRFPIVKYSVEERSKSFSDNSEEDDLMTTSLSRRSVFIRSPGKTQLQKGGASIDPPTDFALAERKDHKSPARLRKAGEDVNIGEKEKRKSSLSKDSE